MLPVNKTDFSQQQPCSLPNCRIFPSQGPSSCSAASVYIQHSLIEVFETVRNMIRVICVLGYEFLVVFLVPRLLLRRIMEFSCFFGVLVDFLLFNFLASCFIL